MYLYQYVDTHKVGAVSQSVVCWSVMLWNLVTASHTIPVNLNVEWVKSRFCRYIWVGNAFSFAMLARAVAQLKVIPEFLDLNPSLTGLSQDIGDMSGSEIHFVVLLARAVVQWIVCRTGNQIWFPFPPLISYIFIVKLFSVSKEG